MTVRAQVWLIWRQNSRLEPVGTDKLCASIAQWWAFCFPKGETGMRKEMTGPTQLQNPAREILFWALGSGGILFGLMLFLPSVTSAGTQVPFSWLWERVLPQGSGQGHPPYYNLKGSPNLWNPGETCPAPGPVVGMADLRISHGLPGYFPFSQRAPQGCSQGHVLYCPAESQKCRYFSLWCPTPIPFGSNWQCLWWCAPDPVPILASAETAG